MEKIDIEELRKALYIANETYISAVYTVDESQAALAAAKDAYYIAFWAWDAAIATCELDKVDDEYL